MEYTVENATLKKTFEGSKGGTFNVFTVMLSDGQTVELVQKQESPVPAQGDKLDGTIEKTDYGLKFKKTQAFGGGGGYKPKSIEEQKAINRAVAQKNAILLLGVEVQAGKSFAGESAATLLTPRIEFLYADLEKAAGR